MKDIRINQPAENMFGNKISVDPSDREVVITFFGELHGVRLVERGKNDPHICFEILAEDDGHWFASDGSASSSCAQASSGWNLCRSSRPRSSGSSGAGSR